MVHHMQVSCANLIILIEYWYKQVEPIVQIRKMQAYLLGLSTPYPRIAYLYAVISYLSIAIMQILAKVLYQVLDPWSLMIFRASCLLVINSWIVHGRGNTVNIKDPVLFRSLVKRVFFTIMMIVTTFFCVKYIPVSTNVTLQNTSPILVYFIQAFLFNKTPNMRQVGLTFFCFLGVIFILQPSFIFPSASASSPFQTNFEVFVGFFAIFGAFCTAMNLSYIHQQAGKIPSAVNLEYTYIGRIFFAGCIANVLDAKADFSKVTLTHVLIFLAFLFFSFVTQFMMFISNSLKKPSCTMPFGYIGVVVGFTSDVFYFGVDFNWLSIFGMLLTSIGLLGKLILPHKKPQPQKEHETESLKTDEHDTKKKSIQESHAQL